MQTTEEPRLECPLCGQGHRATSLRRGERALCVRCGSTIAEEGWFGAETGFVFALTGLVLLVPALLLPFVTLRKAGNERIALLGSSFEGLLANDFGLLGAWVIFCGLIAPLILLCLVFALRATARSNRWWAWNAPLRQWAERVQYWALPEVQVLGVMVAFFKLGDVVAVSVGPGLWCYGAASICTLLAWRRFNLQPAPSADGASESTEPPTRPGPSSLFRPVALAASAVILLVPAYLLPVMHLGTVGQTTSDTTIFSGMVQLWRQGLGGLAVIVFTASFLVPLLKLTGLACLLAAVRWRRLQHARLLTRIYGAIDLIGRWSMMDVFLVAFLTGAVRFGRLASAQPRLGIIAFAAVVVLTMSATWSFDPRLLWVRSAPAGGEVAKS